MFFYIFVLIILTQRVIELFIAKRNEAWMKEQGGYEAGSEHYPLIVWLHILFFVSLLIEVHVIDLGLSSIWVPLLVIFIGAQALRIWSILSLGRYWNTKIIILPQAKIQRKGPYQWLKHPNYMVVAFELAVIPLLFGAYITASLFTILNALLLGLVRIPAEETALAEATDYQEVFDKNLK